MKRRFIVLGLLAAVLAGPAVPGAQQGRAPADLEVEAFLEALQREEKPAPMSRQEETRASESVGTTPTVRDLYEMAWRAAARAARGVNLEDAWQALCQRRETITVDIQQARSLPSEENQPRRDGVDIPTLCRQHRMP